MIALPRSKIIKNKWSGLAFCMFIFSTLLMLMEAGTVVGETLSLQWSYKANLAVSAVAISENGEYIVAGSSTLYFFRRENRDPLWTYTIGASITKISITPDGKYIALAAGDKVYLFDNQGNKLLERYLMQPEQEGELVGTSVEDVAISSDGSYVVAVSSLNVNLFSKTGTRLWYAYGSPAFEDIKTVAISGRGEKIVCGDDESFISLFNTDGSRLAYQDLGSPIADIEISNDGSKIVAITEYRLVLLSSSLNIIWDYSLTAGRYVDMTPDGARIVAADLDSGIYVFSSSSPTPLWQKQVFGINGVAISPDGQFVSVATNTGIFVYRENGIKVGEYPTEDIVEATDVANGPYVVAGTFTNDILLFSANTPPILTESSLSPLVGNENTIFTYRVKYIDADGDAPLYVRVFIDGIPHEMTGETGDYTRGVFFEFSTKLSAGSHLYYFTAMDNRGAEVRLPPTSPDVLSGPVVTTGGGEGGGGEVPPPTGRPSLPVLPIAIGITILAVIVILLMLLR